MCSSQSPMRIPRSVQLYEDFNYVHLYWRCHNKEFYLANNKEKDLYLSSLKKAQKAYKEKGTVKPYAFCVMDNHFHQVTSYDDGSKNLSDYMRVAHSDFGREYNKLHNRSGKVAEGRPKTPPIENTEHLARVHFYVEANPVRAGKMPLGRLRDYKYSSHQFFAYGIKGPHSDLIEIPDWYMELGDSPRKRQKEYRKLFEQYLELNKVGHENYIKQFIGSPIWERAQMRRALIEITGDHLTDNSS